MEYSIDTSRGILPVFVTEKSVKNIRLRVFPSKEIRLSVPSGTSSVFISNFIQEKKNWINTQLERFKETEAIEKEDTIRSGTSTRILGRQLIIKIVAARKKRIMQDDLTLFIYTPVPEDQQDIDSQFMNWWQKNSKQYFLQLLDQLFPIVGKHGISKPEVIVKRMQTLWGSCNRRNKSICLNYYLYKAPVPCIEYIILHELLHLMYPHHDRNFYDLLTIYMPDWQVRKRMLDYEIVLGV